MHGGINFDPYRRYTKGLFLTGYELSGKLQRLRGIFWIPDDPSDSSLLLLTDNGVYFEFILMNMLVRALRELYRF